MSDDDPAKVSAAPSAWASSKPALGPAVVHAHPLPGIVRVLLIAYGVLLGVTLAAIVWIVLVTQKSDADKRAIVEANAKKAVAEAVAAGQQRDAANAEKTRQAVCTVLAESIKPGPGTRTLAKQLRCGLPPAASPSPTFPGVVPGPTPRPPAGDRADPSPAPRPRSSPSPSTRPTRRPSPSPSPTCSGIVVLGQCIPPGGTVSGVRLTTYLEDPWTSLRYSWQ